MNFFLTGATGFLGEYLLIQMLKKGDAVWALYRDEAKRIKTCQFLSDSGLNPSDSRLHWLKGDVVDIKELWLRWEREFPAIREVDQLLHSAASLRFRMNPAGEPKRTNLEGAKALWQLTQSRPIKVHLVSTAYVCGLITGGVVFEINHPRGNFLNSYDESKWEAEQIWAGQATIIRPGVIIGDSRTGRCTSFTGWYVFAKGAYLLEQFLNFAPAYNRYELGIEIPMNPLGTINLVPVDYVAEASIQLIQNPANHNRVFHLTHPQPVTHQWSQDVLCRRFRIGGITFSGSGASPSEPADLLKKMIWDQTRVMHAFFSNNPTFDRANTDQSLPSLKAPVIDEILVDKLLDYAIAHNWG